MIVDSGGGCYKANGGRLCLENQLKAVGFKNIVVDVITGGMHEDFYKSIMAYVQDHQVFLQDDGSNHGILPPGFNLLLMDNYNEQCQTGTCFEPIQKYWDFFSGKVCDTMRYFQTPIYFGGATGKRFGIKNADAYDNFTKSHRAMARMHGGAVAFDGSWHWDRLEKYCVNEYGVLN